MSKRNDLTEQCLAGNAAPTAPCNYLFSSDYWLAFRAGQKCVGMEIASCHKTRGHAVRVVTKQGGLVLVSIRDKDVSVELKGRVS